MRYLIFKSDSLLPWTWENAFIVDHTCIVDHFLLLTLDWYDTCGISFVMGKVTKESLVSMPSQNTNGKSLLQCLTSFKKQLDSKNSGEQIFLAFMSHYFLSVVPPGRNVLTFGVSAEGSMLIKRAPGTLLQPDVPIKRIREARDVGNKVPARPAQSPICSAPLPGLDKDAVQNAKALVQIDAKPQESPNYHEEQLAESARRTQDEASTSGRPGKGLPRAAQVKGMQSHPQNMQCFTAHLPGNQPHKFPH